MAKRDSGSAMAEPVERTTTTTTKERIVANQPAEGSPPPPGVDEQERWERFWENIRTADWNGSAYCYLYRLDAAQRGPWGQGYLRKYDQLFTIDQIKEEFGGGRYRAMLQSKAGLIDRLEFSIDAPRKIPEYQQKTVQDQPLVAVLQKLVEQVMEQREKGVDTKAAVESAMDMQKAAFVSALNTLSTSREILGAPGNTAADGLMQKFLAVAIDRLLSPAPAGEPSRLAGLTEKFLQAAVDRLLAPPAATVEGGARNWETALAMNAPALADNFSRIAEHWARISENNRMVAEMNLRARQAGLPAPAPSRAPRAQAVSSPPQASPVSPSPIAPTTSTQQTRASAPVTYATEAMPDSSVGAIHESPLPVITGPSEAWIKQRIVQQILANEPGDAIGDWLDRTDPASVTALGRMTQEQLEQYFRTDPVLGAVRDDPRLPQVIREFLEFATGRGPGEPVQ